MSRSIVIDKNCTERRATFSFIVGITSCFFFKFGACHNPRNSFVLRPLPPVGWLFVTQRRAQSVTRINLHQCGKRFDPSDYTLSFRVFDRRRQMTIDANAYFCKTRVHLFPLFLSRQKIRGLAVYVYFRHVPRRPEASPSRLDTRLDDDGSSSHRTACPLNHGTWFHRLRRLQCRYHLAARDYHNSGWVSAPWLTAFARAPANGEDLLISLPRLLAAETGQMYDAGVEEQSRRRLDRWWPPVTCDWRKRLWYVQHVESSTLNNFTTGKSNSFRFQTASSTCLLHARESRCVGLMFIVARSKVLHMTRHKSQKLYLSKWQVLRVTFNLGPLLPPTLMLHAHKTTDRWWYSFAASLDIIDLRRQRNEKSHMCVTRQQKTFDARSECGCRIYPASCFNSSCKWTLSSSKRQWLQASTDKVDVCFLKKVGETVCKWS